MQFQENGREQGRPFQHVAAILAVPQPRPELLNIASSKARLAFHTQLGIEGSGVSRPSEFPFYGCTQPCTTAQVSSNHDQKRTRKQRPIVSYAYQSHALST
eukprot:6101773-Amphidinium_carterae.2